jgi:hypothetical protein
VGRIALGIMGHTAKARSGAEGCLPMEP